jgi:hypothetical protein
MKNLAAACLAAAAMLLAGTASAQTTKRKPKPKPQPAQTEAAPEIVNEPQSQPAAPPASVEPQVPPTETKTYEGPVTDPNIPDIARRPRVQPPSVATHRYTKDDYPDEIVKRPLTLAAEQAQISLDVPLSSNGGNPTLTQILRAGVGLTRDWQVGVTYGFGLDRLDAQPGEKGYEAGKAFSVETAYTIIPQYLAAELSFAFFADPDLFGMSLAIGVPFKIEIGDQWAFFGGRNLIRVKLHGLDVDPADPAYNLAQSGLIQRGVSPDDGRVQLDVGVVFQPQTNVAVFGTFGVGWPDFSTHDQPFSTFVGAVYTAAHRFDLGARIGFDMLDHLSDSFAASVFVAVRL